MIERFLRFFRKSSTLVEATGDTAETVRPSQAVLGPGAPVSPLLGYYDRLREAEPRTFQYIPGVNATIVPRMGYGLPAFADLKRWAEVVPEVAHIVRMIIREMLNFSPTLYDANGDPLQEAWLVRHPDGRSSWSVWFSRFLYNVLVYDAPAVFIRRDHHGRPVALRVLDGSTLFVLIDERGEIPEPPSPAFQQIIWGVPFGRPYRADEIWYHPRNPRVDAPYGTSSIEEAITAVQLLERLWDFEISEYTYGTMPNALISAPATWKMEEIAAYQREFDIMLSGNSALRRRVIFVPEGMKIVATHRPQFNRELYNMAFERVALAFGVPPAELGKLPGEGLGGKGFIRGMQSAFFRQCIGPLKAFVEDFFNDILRQMGLKDYSFALEFPPAELDPAQNVEQTIQLFQAGLLTLNQALARLGMDPVEGGDVRLVQVGKRMVPMEEIVPEIGEEKVGSKPETRAKEDPRFAELIARMEEMVERLRKERLAKAVEAAPISMPQPGRNEVRVVAMEPEESGEKEDVPGVFKPEAGEHPKLQERVGGKLAVREAAFFRLSEALGWGLVPPTRVVEVGEGEEGSVQRYVTGRLPAKPPGEYDERAVIRAALLDIIGGNIDRHTQNWLTDPEDPRRPVLIDNGLSFPVRPMRPDHSAFVEHVEGQPIPDAERRDLVRLLQDQSFWEEMERFFHDQGEDIQAVRLARDRLRMLLIQGEIRKECYMASFRFLNKAYAIASAGEVLVSLGQLEVFSGAFEGANIEIRKALVVGADPARLWGRYRRIRTKPNGVTVYELCFE